MKPLVSILIPAYNVEQYLAETLDSALAQTWKNIEIIIVDDGSKDSTLEIAKQYESSIVKVIHQANQGQSASENRALQEAQGEFIQYLDADDLLVPDKIERQIQLLGDSSSPYVAAGEWSRFYQSPQEAKFTPQPPWADMAPVDWLLCVWDGHYMMHGAAWLIPRPIVDRAGKWTEHLSLINDFDYFSRIVLASKGVKFCWGAKTYYRSGNPQSLSGTKSYLAWHSAFCALELGTQNLLAHEDSPRSKQICANLYQRFIYEIYPDALDIQDKAIEKIYQWGGATLSPPGSSSFRLLSRLIGWKRAKQLQSQVYRWGYQQFRSNQVLKSH
ncbi:MAG: glycosyltransferase [Plectolyngbya sp. WJT66-NPBG17]|jgi:glycosyltransferase involved in cell wall biosynthesis|nr:glycosyltransferase [Plectolyngbya sp. WJT66-NPBG17]